MCRGDPLKCPDPPSPSVDDFASHLSCQMPSVVALGKLVRQLETRQTPALPNSVSPPWQIKTVFGVVVCVIKEPVLYSIRFSIRHGCLLWDVFQEAVVREGLKAISILGEYSVRKWCHTLVAHYLKKCLGQSQLWGLIQQLKSHNIWHMTFISLYSLFYKNVQFLTKTAQKRKEIMSHIFIQNPDLLHL